MYNGKQGEVDLGVGEKSLHINKYREDNCLCVWRQHADVELIYDR